MPVRPTYTVYAYDKDGGWTSNPIAHFTGRTKEDRAKRLISILSMSDDAKYPGFFTYRYKTTWGWHR